MLPTKQDFEDVKRDLDDLEEIINGTTPSVATRLGRISKTINQQEEDFNSKLIELQNNYAMTAINGGVWASGKIFTSFNQYMIYSDIAYKPKSSVALPFVVGSVPDAVTVEVISNLSVGQANNKYVRNDLKTLSQAIASADLKENQAISLSNDGVWNVVDASSNPPLADKVLACTGVPTLSLKRRPLGDITMDNGVSLSEDIDYLRKRNLKQSIANGKQVVTGSTNDGMQLKTDGYVDLVLPYGVVIGDSIAKGATELNSRLDNSDQVPAHAYRPEMKNQKGQISYELGRHLNVPVVNQGVGGDTTAQVKLRWNRDVLSITDTFDSDYPTGVTMEFDGQIPYFVYLHAGINDSGAGDAISVIKNNFNFFAQSCIDNNIILMVATLGGTNSTNVTANDRVAEINEYLRGDYLVTYPSVYLVDYELWSTNGTDETRFNRNGQFKMADNVHPSRNGYKDYVDFMINSLAAPVRLGGLELQSITDHANYSRVDTFFTNGNTYTNITTKTDRKTFSGNLEKATFSLGVLQDNSNPILRIVPQTYNVISGAGDYAGWSALKGVFTSARGSGGVTRLKDNAAMPLNHFPNGQFMDWPTGDANPPTGLLGQTGSVTFTKTTITDAEMAKMFQFSCKLTNASASSLYARFLNLERFVAGKDCTILFWVKGNGAYNAHGKVENLTQPNLIQSQEGRFGSQSLTVASTEWQKVVLHTSCARCLPSNSIRFEIFAGPNDDCEITGLAIYEGYIENPRFELNPNEFAATD